MNLISILVAVALVVFFLWTVIKAQLAGRRKGAYYLRKSLFTPAERVFLEVLERAVPAGVRVFGKVRLEDIFGVTSGLDRAERLAARNKINRKHVDFLLVKESDLAPLAGIELDDSSHEADDRKQSLPRFRDEWRARTGDKYRVVSTPQRCDVFVDSAFASAGLPLLHVPAQKAYSLADLKAELAEMLFKAAVTPTW